MRILESTTIFISLCRFPPTARHDRWLKTEGSNAAGCQQDRELQEREPDHFRLGN